MLEVLVCTLEFKAILVAHRSDLQKDSQECSFRYLT